MLPQLAAQFSEPFAEEVDRRVPGLKVTSVELEQEIDDSAVDAEAKGDRADVSTESVVDEHSLGSIRTRSLDELCEDYLREMAGVCEDFPYHAALLDKKDLGIKTVPAKEVRLGSTGKVKVSNRQSFQARGKGQVAPPKDVSSF